MKIEQLPREIKVGPLHISIELSKSDLKVKAEEKEYNDQLLGMFIADEQRILVDPEQAKDSFCDTILHEVLHSLFATHAGNVVDSDTEETLVSNLSMGMLDFMRTNPDLISFLMKFRTEPHKMRKEKPGATKNS